jgi:hypothetical protein
MAGSGSTSELLTWKNVAIASGPMSVVPRSGTSHRRGPLRRQSKSATSMTPDTLTIGLQSVPLCSTSTSTSTTGGAHDASFTNARQPWRCLQSVRRTSGRLPEACLGLGHEAHAVLSLLSESTRRCVRRSHKSALNMCPSRHWTHLRVWRSDAAAVSNWLSCNHHDW